MFSLRALVRSVIVAGAILVVASLAWPAVRRAFAGVFRWVGELVFLPLSGWYDLRFEPIDKGPGEADVLLRIREGADHGFWLSLESRVLGYYPMTIFFALALATPVPWSRRWRALVWGGILVSVYAYARVGLYALEGLARHSAGCKREHVDILRASWFTDALRSTNRLSLFEPAAYGAPVFLIWLIVFFARRDARQQV